MCCHGNVVSVRMRGSKDIERGREEREREKRERGREEMIQVIIYYDYKWI